MKYSPQKSIFQISYDPELSFYDRLYKNENLTNRAGFLTGSNSSYYGKVFCALPFVDLNISYTGNCKLCCFDAIGETYFGNIHNLSLIDLWKNEKFESVRENMLANNRKTIPLCCKCNFDGFRDPLQDWILPLMREDMLVS